MGRDLHPAAYRVGQAMAMLRARLGERDRAEALATLPANLQAAFLGMSERDQHHAVRVLRRARRAAVTGDPEMLRAAALLHDVGKAQARLGIPGRSLVVLARAAHLDGVLRRTPGLGRRFDAYMRHAEIGARLLAEAGADPRLVTIVREHDSPHPTQPETISLQELDGRE